MILDRRSDLTDIRPCGREITGEMSAAHRIDGKDQTIDNEDPCEEEVPEGGHHPSGDARTEHGLPHTRGNAAAAMLIQTAVIPMFTSPRGSSRFQAKFIS